MPILYTGQVIILCRFSAMPACRPAPYSLRSPSPEAGLGHSVTVAIASHAPRVAGVRALSRARALFGFALRTRAACDHTPAANRATDRRQASNRQSRPATGGRQARQATPVCLCRSLAGSPIYRPSIGSGSTPPDRGSSRPYYAGFMSAAGAPR